MKPDVAVVVSQLVTGYRGQGHDTVVSGPFSAELHSGELTCLLGPNGAGKSTLLRTLSAFQTPLRGDISIVGRSLDSYSETELAKVIGVVLTDKIGVNNMTVAQLVGLGRSPYTGFWGTLGDDDREVVDEAMTLVGIAELRDRAVQSLSDGERQKAMIAKALAQQTPVIFLDEPTAFLDYPSKVEIMRVLHSLSRSGGKTIFLSTHDLELALQIADCIWLMDKKLGIVTGSPEDLSLNGSMSRYFERDGIRFDMDAGVFHIDYRPGCSVKVTGCGARYNMVRKALLRNGVGCDESSDDVVVEVGDDDYSVNGCKVATIAEVVNEVMRLC